ncbi:hypothetical protein [Lacisediminihabitans sp.]|uniref:hypothetical protein n=1 Tax=Lacisediminihabitans sp. TaxID=2787631 RepID=UPI00374DA045
MSKSTGGQMLTQLQIRVLLGLSVFVFSLTGCSSTSDIEYGSDAANDPPDSYEQSDEQAQDEADAYLDQQRSEDFAAAGWRCTWDPTMNDNWHDDYVCSNGTSYDRPNLLPGDSFVERWEIDAAAADYEVSLNR